MWAAKITKLPHTSDYDLYYILRDIHNQKTDGRESGGGGCVSTFQCGKARQILRDVVLTSTFAPTGSDSCVNQSIMTQACVWNPSRAQKCFSHTSRREISSLHLLLRHAVGPQPRLQNVRGVKGEKRKECSSQFLRGQSDVSLLPANSRFTIISNKEGEQIFKKILYQWIALDLNKIIVLTLEPWQGHFFVFFLRCHDKKPKSLWQPEQ